MKSCNKNVAARTNDIRSGQNSPFIDHCGRPEGSEIELDKKITTGACRPRYHLLTAGNATMLLSGAHKSPLDTKDARQQIDDMHLV